MPIRIELDDAMFAMNEKPLCTLAGFEISTFRYRSGVAALRLRNRRGEIVVLPYRGQQIWRASFDGRELTMRSMFEEPAASLVYLESYGAFLIHCGLTAIGAPAEGDDHPLHGELPTASFRDAHLVIDEARQTVTLGGTFRHTVAFSTDYEMHSELTLQADTALIDAHLHVRNRKRTPMPLMYLAHINFRPVDDGELAYTAPYTAEAVRVRRTIPGHITPGPGYGEFIAQLAEDPELHHRLAPGLAFDPEVVFTIDAVADAEGWAHAVQRHPDGTADYVGHRPEQAPVLNRWICRTPDQDAIGFSFPSTSMSGGRALETREGRYVRLEGGESWRCDMRFGLLTAEEAEGAAQHIDAVMGRSGGKA